MLQRQEQEWRSQTRQTQVQAPLPPEPQKERYPGLVRVLVHQKDWLQEQQELIQTAPLQEQEQVNQRDPVPVLREQGLGRALRTHQMQVLQVPVQEHRKEMYQGLVRVHQTSHLRELG